MVRILLVCNAGMSTSLLVLNMEKYCKSVGIEAEIYAAPILQAKKSMKDWDVVMLGPQVRHEFNRLKEQLDGEIPIEIIDMRDYGTMNGQNVVIRALEIIEEFNK